MMSVAVVALFSDVGVAILALSSSDVDGALGVPSAIVMSIAIVAPCSDVGVAIGALSSAASDGGVAIGVPSSSGGGRHTPPGP
jgi:hypothetical protein